MTIGWGKDSLDRLLSENRIMYLELAAELSSLRIPPSIDVLSPREREALAMFGRKQSRAVIAAHFGLTLVAIDKIRESIQAKMGIEGFRAFHKFAGRYADHLYRSRPRPFRRPAHDLLPMLAGDMTIGQIAKRIGEKRNAVTKRLLRLRRSLCLKSHCDLIVYAKQRRTNE